MGIVTVAAATTTTAAATASTITITTEPPVVTTKEVVSVTNTVNIVTTSRTIIPDNCPLNSEVVDGACKCNNGFVAENNKCVSGSFTFNVSFGLVLAAMLAKLLG